MADKEKKSDSHGGDGGMGPVGDTLFWLLLVLVAISFVGGFFAMLHVPFNFPSGTDVIAFIFDKVQIFSIFISLVFFVGIIYCNFKLGQILHHHGGHGHSGDHGHSDGHGHSSHSDESSHANIQSHAPDKRWQDVLKRISSENEADWRFAIIEADIILEDMLSKMGYPGEGVAEKLKKVEKADFHTIQSAWDAHKMRNEIAHSGSSFHLSKSDAERTINLFKEVFEEFYFI